MNKHADSYRSYSICSSSHSYVTTLFTTPKEAVASYLMFSMTFLRSEKQCITVQLDQLKAFIYKLFVILPVFVAMNSKVVYFGMNCSSA
jgi:hypothetical protein